MEEYKEHQLHDGGSTIPLQVRNSMESLRACSLERNTNVWYLFKHNWRQLTSLIPGLLLLSASGSLHFSWTIRAMILYVYKYQDVRSDLILAWFGGVAVGIIVGAWINTKFSKRNIYYFVAVDIVCVSVLFICSPRCEYFFVLVGRALTGMLFGIALLTTITHTADNASQYVRRYLLWTIVIVNILPSILLAEAVSHLFDIVGGADVVIGWLMLFFSVVALIVMPCTYESIIYLLDTGKDLKALEILLKLRNESRHFIRNDFNNMKIMIAEDRNAGANILRQGNWRPLLLIVMLRLLSPLLANNILSTFSIMNIWLDYQRVAVVQVHEAASLMAPPYAVEVNDADDANELFFIHSAYEYKPCVLDAEHFLLFIFVVKLVVGVPLMCWAERLYIYRNRFIFKATLAVAILNLTFCTLSWCSYKLEDNVLIFTFYMFKLQNIINGLFVVVAFAIDVISLNELAEGFSMAKRTASIAFVLTTEYLTHLLYFLPLVLFQQLPFYLNFIHWSVIVTISYSLLWLMPNETLDKTLRDARDKYFISI